MLLKGGATQREIEWDTKVRVFIVRSDTASSSTFDRLPKKTGRLEPRCSLEITVAALTIEPTWSIVTSASVVTEDEPTISRTPVPANQSSNSSGLPTVADRRDALDRLSRVGLDALDHGAQVPAAVVAGKGLMLRRAAPHITQGTLLSSNALHDGLVLLRPLLAIGHGLGFRMLCDRLLLRHGQGP
jgi:hypothetical protein